MKKILLTIAAASTVLLAGCSAAPYQPGLVFSSIDAPVAVGSGSVACTKHGQASATNILGLFGAGNASIAKAKENGGITTVSSVDYNFTSILSLFSTTTTKVCGE